MTSARVLQVAVNAASIFGACDLRRYLVPDEMMDQAEMLASLAITRGELLKRRRRGIVLCLPNGAGNLYPRFQLAPDGRSIDPRVAAQSRQLLDDHSEWEALRWWYSPDGLALRRSYHLDP